MISATRQTSAAKGRRNWLEKVYNTTFQLMRFKPPFSTDLQIFLSAEGCGCLAEGRTRFTFSFSLRLIQFLSRSFAASCGSLRLYNRREPRGLNRISGISSLCQIRCSGACNAFQINQTEDLELRRKIRRRQKNIREKRHGTYLLFISLPCKKKLYETFVVN